MTATCLVTGGAGFIGSHLVAALAAEGCAVRVLDDLSTGHRDNLTAGVEFAAGDVRDAASVRRAAEGVQVVYHLAAVASVQASVERPTMVHDVCATGTLNVLEAARAAGARRVVYAASASAYGLPAGEVQTEDEPLCPLSPYAAAKLAGEMYCRSHTATFGLETVRLRFFNVYGPRQRADSPYSGVIALFARALREGRSPTVFGDGEQSRDFVYVADVVQALLKAGRVEGVAGNVYNVGTGGRTSVLELVAALNAALGTDVRPTHAPPRAGDIRHSRADISRARRDLGFEPTTPFEQGLRHTLAG